MHQQSVASALDEHDVRTFVADITARSAPGNDLLRELGVNSIPLVVAYGPGTGGRQGPLKAHETYTDGMLVDFIRRAAKKDGRSGLP